MPPTSITIFEEGANVESFKIVNDGIFDKKGLDKYMIEIPASYPGSSGCRNIRDVESDLKAVRSLINYVIPPLIFLTANRGEPQGGPANSCKSASGFPLCRVFAEPH